MNANQTRSALHPIAAPRRTRASLARRVRAGVALAAAAALAAPGSALGQAVVHRYSFNDGSTTTATDTGTVGGADGTLVNGATTDGSQLVTVGGGSGSANTSPAASIPGAVAGVTGDFTVETYFTAATTSAGFATLFNFSNATNQTYFIATPNRNNTTGVSSIAVKYNNGAELVVSGPNLNNGAQHQFLTTFTKSTGVVRLYVDGVAIGSGTVAGAAGNFDLSLLTNRAGINGLAGFGDQAINGTNNEFRLYAEVLKPGTAMLSNSLGTDTLASAAVVNTFAAAGTADFTADANWGLGHVPTSSAGSTTNEVAVVGNAATASVATGAAYTSPTQIRITNGGLSVSGAGTVFTVGGGIDLAPGGTAGAAAAVTVSGGGVLVTPGLFVDADVTTAGTAAKTVTLDAGTLQAAGPITVGGTGVTFTLGAGGGTVNTNGSAVTINAPVGGTGGLTKTGGGTLTLTGAGTYGGATLVQNGTLSFATGAIPAGSNLTLASATSATLQWLGANTTDVTAGRTVTLAGTTGSTTIGTFLDTNGNNVTLTGNLAGTNAGFLSKIGTGTLTLQGTANPTSLFVKAGTLVLDGAAAVVTTTNYASIGQANGDNGTLVLRNGAKLTVPIDFNISDVTVSRGSVLVQGTGTALAIRTLYLGKSGASIGALSQSGGTVGPNAAPAGDWRIGGGAGTGDAAAVGTYDLSGGTFSTAQNFQIGAYGKGQLNLTGGTVTVSNGFTATGRFVGSVGQLNVAGGTFNFTSTGTQLGAVEQGTGSINVFGTGTVTTASNAGLNLSINGGTGQVNLGTGGTLGAKLVFQGAAAGTSGTFNFHGGALRATAAGATFMQGLTNAYVWPEGGTIDTNGNNVTVAQNLLAPPAGNGVGSVAVTGGGTGYVTAPIVQFARGAGDTTGAGAVGVATINASGVVTGVTVLNPGTGYTVAPVVTLLGGNPGTAASGVTGALAATAASGGLTKTGTGTLTLTGANTYAGTTTVSAGVLLMNGSAAGGAAVNTGGTLGGSGTIAGPVVANAGGTVSPGNSAGVLNVGNLTLASGSTALMELNGTTAGSQYDQLNVTGTVTLGGGALQVALGYTPLVGDAYTIINNDGTADPVAGTFAGLPASGSTFQSGGATFAINYAGGDGNDVTLTTTVPEPTSAGALLGAAAVGLLARRRRAR